MSPRASESSRPRLTAAESRQAIIDAADSLLRSGPYRDLSVEAVMSEAGLSRTIFYRHFDDLPDLVTELLRALGNDLDSNIGDAAVRVIEEPTVAGLREAFRPFVDFFAEHGMLVRCVADAVGSDDRLREGYDGIIRHFTSVTADALATVSRRLPVLGVDIDSLAAALNAMNERYLVTTLGRTPQEDREHVLDTIAAVWARTLGIS